MFACWARVLSTAAVLAAAPALAQTAGDDGPDLWAVTGVRSDDALNLRVAPNADSRRIAKIPFNARGIKNLGCPSHVTFEQWRRMTQAQRDRAARSRWCQVEYNGVRGWVASRFLKEDGIK
jgi:SH3-like domain-containing protein